MATQTSPEVTIKHTHSAYTITNYPINQLATFFKALKECGGEESHKCKLYRESNERKNSGKTTTDIGIVLPVGADQLQKFKVLAGITTSN